jgi:hypothetical protein
MISSDNWVFIKRICLTQEFWLNQADQKNSRSKIMYKVSKKNYYADWTLIQLERVEKAYEKLSRDMRIRKNKLQSFSVQSSSIQLSSSSSSSSQASRSSFSSIETHQNDALSEIRTQYESNSRQNRHIDIRNRQFTESRHEDRSFNFESRFENQYDRESNRFRNRQYEFTEYAVTKHAVTKYADENSHSMNLTRRASQSDYHALESYVSSSSPAKIIYSKELSRLNKLYKNEEKFESTKNNFDFKLTIYLDKCKYADLSKHAYEKNVLLMLTNETLTYYYANKNNFITFNDFCISMRLYFESSEWRDQNLDKWHIITFENVVAINSNASLIECLHKMCSQMNIIQRDLNSAYHDSIRLRKNIIRVCKDHSALIYEIINSSIKIFALMNILQSSIINYEVIRKLFASQQYHQNDEINNHYFIDRQYRRDEYDRRDKSSSDRRVEFYRDEFRDRSNDKFANRRSKKCFVCGKFDCWSINHLDKKREDSKKRFSDRFSQFRNNNRLNQYICEYESTDENDDHDEMIQYFEKHSISIISASISTIISAISSTNFINALLIEFESNKLFLTSFDELQSIEFDIITSLLANQTFEHRFFAKNCIIITIFINESFNFISTTDSRYDDREFKSILMNCDAAERSIEDIEQFKALERMSNDVKLNTKTIESSIKFGIDNTLILEFVDLNTSFEIITFHIIEMNTSFLLCLNDLNRLRIYFNNLINEMIQKMSDIQISSKIRRHSIIRRYDHAFLLWKILTYSLIAEFIDENSCLLIEIELRRLHRRFDHLSTRCLYEILTRSDHDNVESRVIEHLNKYCHHCQMHEKSFERFSFSIRNSDSEFNFNILMNILYIEARSNENKLVLHLINEITRFQADRWLKDISAKHVWDQFRTC